jgi:hypothetical protein
LNRAQTGLARALNRCDLPPFLLGILQVFPTAWPGFGAVRDQLLLQGGEAGAQLGELALGVEVTLPRPPYELG